MTTESSTTMRAVAEQLAATRVVLTPSAKPPHKLDQPLMPVESRLETCRLTYLA